MLNRFGAVKLMNDTILSLGDDDSYCEWIKTMPDNANDDTIQEIVEDTELYGDVCKAFCNIMKIYARKGGI